MILLTIKEAAKYLRLSEVTIRRYVRDGVIQVIRLNNHSIRISNEEIERIINPNKEDQSMAKEWAEHNQ